MMRWIVCVGLLWFPLVSAPAAPAAAAAAAPAEPKRPNVVLIVADDLGYADLGAQNISKDVRTPHIDSLATGGARFTDASAALPQAIGSSLS